MKISRAFGDAWRVWRAHPMDTLKFILVEICLAMICLVPVLFLTGDRNELFALLVVPLFLFVGLPARISSAEAQANALRGGRLCSPLLLSGASSWLSRLVCALKRAFFLLIWSAPLIAEALIIQSHWSGEVDGFTVLRIIKRDLGAGDTIRGVLVIVLAVLFALLIVAIGCAFHSGARHAFAQGNSRLVNGHHGKIMLTWLCSEITLLPFIIAAGIAVYRYLPALRELENLLMGAVNLPSTRTTLIILGIGALLTLPLLPLRSLIPAAFVNGLAQEENHENPA